MAMASDEADEEAARTLIAANWRQCSIFRLPPGYSLDPRIAFDPATDWLIVCSQSCTVCSRRFKTDPSVEVAVAVQGPKFHERSPEAKGGNARKLMLPILGVPGVGAVTCDVNRRTFLDRRHFLPWRPASSMSLSEQSRRLFQGWLARGYIRIAMPDALVTRLVRKPDGLFTQVRAVLDGGKEAPLHPDVPSIFVRWLPDRELADGVPYEFHLLFACDDEATVRRVTEELEDRLRPFRTSAGQDGIVLSSLDAEIIGEITLRQANTYSRLSEWDELSELGEVAEDHLAAMLRLGAEPG